MAKFEARKIFTGFEREVLLGEIERYKSAVENKSTKANANNEKTAAWMEITQRFNSTPGVHYRRMAQLQGYYQNLKRRAMKKKAEKRIDLYKTGGGPASTNNLDPTEERLIEMGVLRTPLSNVYDDDHTYHAITEIPPTHLQDDNSFSDTMEPHSEREEFMNQAENETEQPGPSNANFVNETPGAKRTPVSRWKIKRKRKTPCTAVAAMAIAEERKVAAEQLKLKSDAEMDLKREEHELLMAQRREEHVLNMQTKQEEHDLKMAIMHEKLNILKILKESAINGTYKGNVDL